MGELPGELNAPPEKVSRRLASLRRLFYSQRDEMRDAALGNLAPGRIVKL